MLTSQAPVCCCLRVAMELHPVCSERCCTLLQKHLLAHFVVQRIALAELYKVLRPDAKTAAGDSVLIETMGVSVRIKASRCRDPFPQGHTCEKEPAGLIPTKLRVSSSAARVQSHAKERPVKSPKNVPRLSWAGLLEPRAQSALEPKKSRTPSLSCCNSERPGRCLTSFGEERAASRDADQMRSSHSTL